VDGCHNGDAVRSDALEKGDDLGLWGVDTGGPTRKGAIRPRPVFGRGCTVQASSLPNAEAPPQLASLIPNLTSLAVKLSRPLVGSSSISTLSWGGGSGSQASSPDAPPKLCFSRQSTAAERTSQGGDGADLRPLKPLPLAHRGLVMRAMPMLVRLAWPPLMPLARLEPVGEENGAVKCRTRRLASSHPAHSLLHAWSRRCRSRTDFDVAAPQKAQPGNQIL
jgi:hypothetical protein